MNKSCSRLQSLLKSLILVQTVFLMFFFLTPMILNAQITPPTTPNPADQATVKFTKFAVLNWMNPAYTKKRQISISDNPNFTEGHTLVSPVLEYSQYSAAPVADSYNFDLEQLGIPTTNKDYYWKVHVWCPWNSENESVWEFHNEGVGRITGTKFRDNNGNGERDINEPGIKGWKIYLKGSGVSQERTTDENGFFSFDIPGIGSFELSEENVNGWNQTAPKYKTHSIPVTNINENFPGFDFGNQPPDPCQLISPSNNSDRVSIRPTFQWMDADDAVSCTLIINLAGGEEVFRKSFTAVPGSARSFQLPDKLLFSTSYHWKINTVTATGNYETGPWSFTTCAPATITGKIFRDNDGNGIMDANDSPLSGWNVTMKDDHDVEETVQSGQNGTFTFHVGDEGTYSITAELKLGWIKTLPSASAGYQVEIKTENFGQIFYNKDFGNKPPLPCQLISPQNNAVDVSFVTNFRWRDAEDAVAIVLVVYQNQTEVRHINITPKPGQEQNHKLANALDMETEYSWNILTYNSTGTSNSPAVEQPWKFTTCGLGKISGHKYRDDNGNGQKDSNEPGISGWKITVNGEEIITGSDGYYEYKYANPGTYTVTEEDKFGWERTNPSNGSYTLELDAGMEISGNDFLNKPPVSGYLIYPPDSAKKISVRPEFRWRTPGDAEKLTLYVESSDHSKRLYDIPPVPEQVQSFRIPDTLLSETLYYWWVASNGTDISNEMFSFTTECEPVDRILPVNNCINYEIDPEFIWKNPPGSSGTLSFIIAHSGKVFTYTLNVQGEFQHYKLPEPLPYNSDVYWQIKRECSNSTDEYYYFKTKHKPTELIDPGNNTIGIPIRTGFLWYNGSDAVTVDLILLNENGTKAAEKLGIPAYPGEDQMRTFENKLKQGTKYKWYVVTHTDNSTYQTEMNSFRTVDIDVQYPPDEEIFVDTKPEIKWTNPDAGSDLKLKFYDCTMSLYSEYGISMLAGGSQGFKIENELKNAAKYYWGFDVNSIPPEKLRQFTTEPAPPEQKNPPDGVPMPTTKLKFEWDDALPKTEDAECYRNMRTAFEVSIIRSSFRPGKSNSSKLTSLPDIYTYFIPADTGDHFSLVITDTLDYDTRYAWTVTTYYDTIAIRSDTAYITTGKTTGVIDSEIPSEFALEQNYPNPFNPVTVINYRVASSADILIKIYNMIGKEIGVLVNGKKTAGLYKIEWRAEDLPSGIYFYSLRAAPEDGSNDFRSVKKMILLK